MGGPQQPPSRTNRPLRRVKHQSFPLQCTKITPKASKAPKMALQKPTRAGDAITAAENSLTPRSPRTQSPNPLLTRHKAAPSSTPRPRRPHPKGEGEGEAALHQPPHPLHGLGEPHKPSSLCVSRRTLALGASLGPAACPAPGAEPFCANPSAPGPGCFLLELPATHRGHLPPVFPRPGQKGLTPFGSLGGKPTSTCSYTPENKNSQKASRLHQISPLREKTPNLHPELNSTGYLCS